jgi:membrane-bound serine protease (ClpP class)
VFPGVAGAICLLLGLTALHVLPVSTSGLALVALGVLLLVAELFVPAGVLGAGGAAAIVLGSLFLFDPASGVRIARSLVFGVGGSLAAVMAILATLVVRAQRRPVAVGAEAMIGEVGVVTKRLAPTGTVLVHGEYWTAEADEPIEAGERVAVTVVRGLSVRVRRATPRSSATGR